MEQRFALLLGNSQYEDATLARLSAPQGDASSFADVLQNPEIGGFTQVSTLVNQPANDIRIGIARFFANRNRDDLLLLYFSGHGVLDDRGRLFLAAKDSDHDLLNATAIDAAFITDAMDRSRSTRQILILDCCHSGAFARGSKGALGASVGTASAFEGTGSGRVILTATDATQYAWEGEKIIGAAENSVFTHHLIEGLRTGQADRNEDGWIALDEWFDYVYDQVIEETPKQTPGKWSYKQQGEILIARNPHPVSPKSTLPQEMLDTIADPRSWVREGVVAELERLLRTGSQAMARAAHAALEELVNDDSRRVSSAAAASLAVGQNPQTMPDSGAALPSQPAPQIQAEIPINLLPLTSDRTISGRTGRTAPLHPEVENKGLQEALPLTSQKKAEIPKIATNFSKSPLSIVVFFWCFGWIASLGVALAQDNSSALIWGWLFAGLIGDLFIWGSRPDARFSRLPLLTLGWPSILIIVFTVSKLIYPIVDNAGSDTGKNVVVSLVMLLWMILAGIIAALRVQTVAQAPGIRSALLKVILCWGGILVLTLWVSGTYPWRSALSSFLNSSPQSVFDNLGGSPVSYFELGLNGCISGIFGSLLWYLWISPKQAPNQV